MLDFFKLVSEHYTLSIIIAWLIWPGLMFLVGWIFESRMVPVFKNQSMAFLPGDFVFELMYVALALFYVEATEINPNIINAIQNPGWVALSALFAFFIFLPLRRRDRGAYPKRAFYSPTKLCHDICGYYFIPFMLIWLEYPAISYIVRDEMIRGQSWWLVGIIAVCWFIYGACVIHDMHDIFLASYAPYMHPENWKPLWKKTPPQ